MPPTPTPFPLLSTMFLTSTPPPSPPAPPAGDEAGAEELRKELLKGKAKLMAAMQRQSECMCP
jgi:hypothetical protein